MEVAAAAPAKCRKSEGSFPGVGGDWKPRPFEGREQLAVTPFFQPRPPLLSEADS